MRNLLVLLCLAILPGCGGALKERAGTIANATVLAIESAQVSARTLYELQQQYVLQKAEARGATREEVIKEITAVREKWQPLEDLFQKAHETRDLLDNALKLGEPVKEVQSILLQLLQLQKNIADKLREFRQTNKGVSDAATSAVLEDLHCNEPWGFALGAERCEGAQDARYRRRAAVSVYFA